MRPAILALEDGTIFQGKSFGVDGESGGEVIFNTAMSGYQEILTDPSYRKQLVTMTYPLIGNYGITDDDFESSRAQVGGFIVTENCSRPSNHRSIKSLGSFLKEHNIVAIEGIDTRSLTKKIRTAGALSGVISTIDLNPDSLIVKARKVPSMKGLDLASEVTTHERVLWPSKDELFNVAILDLGTKQNIIRQLNSLGCTVTLLPAQTTVQEIIEIAPDGLLLSNGPGDPAAVTYAIETIKSLLGSIPMFGICLGHQLLAHALGGDTEKMTFGHHGANHPVKELSTGKIHITSQNHGFMIRRDSLPDLVKITHVNLNDNSIEGIEAKELKCFSLQYHPEAAPGPRDAMPIFSKFINIMEKHHA